MPQDATVVPFGDDGFGCQYQVRKTRKSPVYLYSSPPSKVTIDDVVSNKSKMEPEENDILRDLQGNQIGSVFRLLKSDEKLLGRKLPGYEDVLEVVTYERLDNHQANMPESGRGIKITSKGYCLAQDVKKADAKFVSNKNPIFPNDDLIADVHQNSFGDCFLLASALSVLHRSGPDFIKEMMRQDEDGKCTTVRLYNPRTLVPVYIKVKNSFYYENGLNLIHHKAPWVHMLEKAYVALAHKKNETGDEIISTYPSFQEIYGEGGDPALAMSVLTGRQSYERCINNENDYPWAVDNLNLSISFYLSTMTLFDKLSSDEIDALDQYLGNISAIRMIEISHELHGCQSLEEIENSIDASFNGNDALIKIIKSHLALFKSEDEQIDFIHSLSEFISRFNSMRAESLLSISKVFSSSKEIFDIGKVMSTALHRLDEVIASEEKVDSLESALKHMQLLEDIGISKDLTTKFREYIFQVDQSTANFHDRKSMYVAINGKTGKGIYTKEDKQLYSYIQELFTRTDVQQAVVVSTKKIFPDKNSIGLCSGHAYAVIEAKRNPSNPALCELTLQNPWGYFGRSTDLAQQQFKEANKISLITATDNPVFTIDLADFVKYFKRVSVGEFVAPVIQPELTLPKQSPKESFIKRHWGKLLLGGLIVTSVVVASIFTLGVAPIVAAGVAGIFSALGVALSSTVATVIGMAGISIVSAGMGVLYGIFGGLIKDNLTAKNVIKEEIKPLLSDDKLEVDELPPKRAFSTARIGQALAVTIERSSEPEIISTNDQITQVDAPSKKTTMQYNEVIAELTKPSISPSM